MLDTALILAGHGSHISPNTAGIVWRYVDRLRAMSAESEITACFWKEPPAFHQVINTVNASNVIIVPVFTAQGYFTQSVLPAELGLDGSYSIKNGKTIRLTPAIGQHEAMGKIVRAIVSKSIDEHELELNDTAVAIIGHGTRRNPNSRDATRKQANHLRQLNWVSEVVDVYLDDDPDISSIYETTRANNIIALPYFLAPGSHVSMDVPRALGVTGKRSPESVANRQVYYTDPVGEDESICTAILDLAREAGLELASNCSAEPWSGFPVAGKETIEEALKAEKVLRFGQVLVSKERVWHCDNADNSVAIASPEELRATVREEPFRPLPSSIDLPAGWHVQLDHPTHAHAVLETIYPGLVADWSACRQNRFVTEPLAITSERQQGIFKGIHKLASDVIENAVTRVCGSCIRQPTWWRADFKADLPCGAACNYWLSKAIKLGEATI